MEQVTPNTRNKTMKPTTTTATDRERLILWSVLNNSFCSESPWVFAVIDASGLGEQEAGGVIASLMIKGLIWCEQYDQDKTMGLTELGKAYCASNEIVSGGTEPARTLCRNKTMPSKETYWLVHFTSDRCGQFLGLEEIQGISLLHAFKNCMMEEKGWELEDVLKFKGASKSIDSNNPIVVDAEEMLLIFGGTKEQVSVAYLEYQIERTKEYC